MPVCTGAQSMFLFTLKNILAYIPTKWCVIIGLGLLPGLLLSSMGEKKEELNKGLMAARTGDYNGALATWLPLARRGSAEAQFRLGWLHETGLGTEQNTLLAAQWYRDAAAQGHSSALYNLGMFSFHGSGLPQDDTKAANYFFEAAKNGHAKAQYNLGVLYQIGRGLPKDLRKARYWFNRAKVNGFVSPDKSTTV